VQSGVAQQALTLLRTIDWLRVDGQAGAHLKSLPGFHEPQGIAVVPDAKAVAVANGKARVFSC